MRLGKRGRDVDIVKMKQHLDVSFLTLACEPAELLLVGLDLLWRNIGTGLRVIRHLDNRTAVVGPHK
ncbi:MAG: hypothetical protein DRP66_02995 [Planctomycetota bacterium]|nr:MAG: hypothetical protein DRP66_02995 [Planctomycetota bacterium]